MSADVLLALGILCTVAHLACDLVKLRVHMHHPRDWFVLVSSVALVGHVVLTGEAASWVSILTR